MYRSIDPPQDEGFELFLKEVSQDFCPFLEPSRRNGTLFFSWYDLERYPAEEQPAHLFGLALIHTEILRQQRLRSHPSEHSYFICENLIVGRDPDCKKILEWPHFILKTLYTRVGILFGKFWVGESTPSIDGRTPPSSPLNFISIRTALRNKDHRFFRRKMSAMLPEYEAHDIHRNSPLFEADWFTPSLRHLMEHAAQTASKPVLTQLADELYRREVFPRAKRWAEGHAKGLVSTQAAAIESNAEGSTDAQTPRPGQIRVEDECAGDEEQFSDVRSAAERVLGQRITTWHSVSKRRGAAVYRLTTNTGTDFAVKYSIESSDSDKSPYSIRRERDALGSLRSITKDYLRAAGRVKDIEFIVTQWLGETSLHQYAKTVRRDYTPQQRDKLLRQLCRAVQVVRETHDAEWLHGDIQPGHFLVTGGDEIQLVDWALARRMKGGPEWKHGGCFVHYAAPEIASAMLEGHDETGYDESAECYALCASLFFLLTGSTAVDYGHEPQDGGRFGHRLKRIATGQHLQEMSQLPSWVPKPMAMCIEAGLRELPAKRPRVCEIHDSMQSKAYIDKPHSSSRAPHAPRWFTSIESVR